MATVTTDLWARIEGFSIDEPSASYNFTAKLARENGWTIAYAERVIREYKRFMYLTVVADHMVVPSVQVDQAWHLHLTYTRSYWGSFCGEVLRQPIHHEPTRGQEETGKFVMLYERTLATYHRVFGEEAPQDIWPEAKLRFGMNSPLRSVNLNQYWVVRKPRLRALIRRVPSTEFSIALAVLPIFGVLNPFEMRGPQFLMFYAVIFLMTFVLACAVRLMGYTDPLPPETDELLSATDLAYMSGRGPLAVHAALGRLLHEGIVAEQEGVSGGTKEKAPKLVVQGKAPEGLDFVERAVYDAVAAARGADPAAIYHVRKAIDKPMRAELARRGLMKPSIWLSTGGMLPPLMMVGVASIGAIKIGIGISRGKPVGFLVVWSIVALGIAALFLIQGGVTAYGKKRMGDAKLKYAGLAKQASDDAATLQPYDVGLLVALFGTTALADSALSRIHTSLTHFPVADNTWSSGSGCSAGSCGGGGGCGGGGCGGCGGD